MAAAARMKATAPPGAVAAHESGHGVIARVLGIEVVRASAKPGEAGVRTRYKIGGSTAAEAAETIEALIVVDLAGATAEQRATGRSEPGAARADERNALRRALQLGLLTSAGLDAAEELVERSRPKAAALVMQHWPAIEAVADALADGQVLTGSEIDALMAAAP